MANDRELWKEQLDACRARHDDWQLPELSELAESREGSPHIARLVERSQVWDGAVGEAMRDVPIPSGLEARLLSSLNVESDSRSPTVAHTPPVTTAERPHGTGSRRRRVVAVIAMSACAASLLFGLLLALPRPADWSNQQDAVVHFQRWLPLVSPNGWHTTHWPKRVLPVRGLDPYGWQSLAATWSTLQADCYDLAPPGPRAYLFVCQPTTEVELLNQVPSTSTSSGDGWSLGAWQDSAGNVFILAVEGNDARYRRLIRPATNLATAHPLRRMRVG